MRNLNKFITGTSHNGYVTEGNVVTVEYENVIVKVIRDSVNKYEVTFNVNDRTYSYKCQSQKEVIECIEYDIAYHDSEIKKAASENEFAEFEKSLNETEEYKEVTSANNAHMSNADRLQAAVSRAFGTDTTILNSNEKYVLIRYSKNGSAEFATFIHDWDSISLGHYFTVWGVDEYDWSNKKFKEVRDRAIEDYHVRI